MQTSAELEQLCPTGPPDMSFRCAQGRFTRNEEPSLDDLLAEPAIRSVMLRDGVEEAAIRRLAAWVRASRVKLSVLEELRTGKQISAE
jgi:hypothetical protein